METACSGNAQRAALRDRAPGRNVQITADRGSRQIEGIRIAQRHVIARDDADGAEGISDVIQDDVVGRARRQGGETGDMHGAALGDSPACAQVEDAGEINPDKIKSIYLINIGVAIGAGKTQGGGMDLERRHSGTDGGGGIVDHDVRRGDGEAAAIRHGFHFRDIEGAARGHEVGGNIKDVRIPQTTTAVYLAAHPGGKIEGIVAAAADERTEIVESQDITGGGQGAAIVSGHRPQIILILTL